MNSRIRSAARWRCGVIAVVLAGLLVPPQAAACLLMGDMNGDGVVNWRDIDPFVAAMNNTSAGHACPIGYWALDGLARDYGCYRNHGVLAGGAAFSPDVPPQVGIGQALSLGGYGDYVYLGTSLLHGGCFDKFTFEVFFKAGTQADPHAAIFSTETSDGEFNLFIWHEGVTEPLLRATVYVAGQPCTLWGPVVTDDQWHHVAIRKNATHVELFLDGALQDSVAATGPLQVNGPWHATIGCKYTDTPHGFFEGLVDEVKIYDRALSDAELAVVSPPPTGVVNLGQHVTQLQFAPDMQNLYVGSHLANHVKVIDIDTLQVLPDPPFVGLGPADLVFNDAGDRLYVSLNPSNEMRIFEVPSFTQLCSTPVGSDAAGIALSPDERRVFLCNHGSHTLSIIDVVGDACTALPELPVGNGPNGIVTSADGARVYAANANDRTVSFIAADTVNDAYSVVCTTPPGLGGNLAYCALRERLYVTSGDSDEVVVVDALDPCNDAVWVRVAVDDGPKFTAVSPNGRYVFVTCEDANTLCVIDADTLGVIRSVPVGSSPQGVAAYPGRANGSPVYVANAQSGSVSVLDPFE